MLNKKNEGDYENKKYFVAGFCFSVSTGLSFTLFKDDDDGFGGDGFGDESRVLEDSGFGGDGFGAIPPDKLMEKKFCRRRSFDEVSQCAER